MNRFKKILAFLVVFVMCLQFVPVTKAANSQDVTYTATLDTPTINVSDEDQTVVLTVKTNKAVSMDSMTAYARVPDGLALKSIANETLGFTGGHYNMNNGKISWYSSDGENVSNDLLATITYTVPANTPAGTYEIEFEIELISSDWGTTWEDGATVSATLTIVEGSAGEPVEPTYAWTKVTDVGQLSADDLVIIVAADYDYALSTTQNKNNRGQAVVTKNGNFITFADDAGVQILTLEEGNFDGSFAFNTGDGYLYAASSSSNHLKTEEDLTDNSSWTITIEDGVTTIVAMGTNTRNIMRYNKSSSLFACYNSSSSVQDTVQLYKRTVVDSTCDHAGATYVAPATPTCQATGNIEHWFCEDCGKYFSDAGCTTEIAQADTVIAKSEHDFTGADDRICTVCGIYKDGSILTIDEVLAYGATLASGATTEYKYYVVGTITSVSNTTYGNIYITDDSENSLLIYGLYDDGVRYDAMATKPVAGDTIKVYGPIQKYGSTIEIVNAELIEHTVPTCYHNNVTFHAAAAATCSTPATLDHYYCDDCKKNYADEACTQVMDTIYVDDVLGDHTPSDEDERICSVCGTYIPNSILTIPEASEFGAGFGHNTYSTGKYYVTGTIQSISSATWGNMTIVDENNNTLYLYGLYSADGETRYDAMTTQPQVGDIITVYGILGQYNGKAQMKNGWMTAHTHEHKASGYDYDDNNHWSVCSCGQIIDGTTAPHDFSHSTEYTPGAFTGTHLVVHYCECGKPEVGETENCVDEKNNETQADGADGLCDFCGEHKCVMTLVTGKAATCSEDGWNDYYFCASCNKYFYEDHDNYFEIENLEEWKIGEGYIAATGEHVYVPGTYTWSGDHSTCTVVGTCACGATATATASSTSSVTTVGTCQTAEVVTYTADFAETWAVDQSMDVTGEKNLNNHTSTDVTYTNNGDTHSATYDCCGGAYVTNEDHDYTTGTSDYTCICGKVQEFTLYVRDNASTTFTVSVPYGATILDYIPAEAYTGITYLNNDYKIGYDKFDSWVISNSHEIMPADTVYVTPRVEFHGWYRGSDGWLYCDGSNDYVKSGWTLINHADYLENGTGSDWYYLDPVTGYRAEGLTRVPYPTVSINGVTYAPNAEDIAYAESKGNTFIDKDEAWFIFDENGKFQSDVTGKYEGTYATCYAVDGMIPWHYGLAKIANKYYYFVGDTVNGGNKVADGPVWITRTNGVEGLENGACYCFLGGVLAHNLTDIVDGKYYENGKLMMGAGLVKLEEGYIFVRSNGQVALGEYWVTEAKANGYVEGGKLYNFGEDGYLVIDPTVNGIVDGVYYKEGVPYYAGLIEIDGDYYYVRSNGEVATGWYYVTKTNGIDLGTNYLHFDEDGKLLDVKNGIYEGEDGKLYYYVNNRVTGAGLIEINGEYYYVKTSTGEVVTGTYYITVTNGMEGFTAGQKRVFDENGKLIR